MKKKNDWDYGLIPGLEGIVWLIKLPFIILKAVGFILLWSAILGVTYYGICQHSLPLFWNAYKHASQ